MGVKPGWPTGIRLDNMDSDYLEQELRREKDRREHQDVLQLFSHRMFHAMADEAMNHRVLNGGIAPWDWKGWNTYAPMLGNRCCCALFGITAARARRLIASGEGFDLTKEVPEGAGPDKGWSRPKGWWEKV